MSEESRAQLVALNDALRKANDAYLRARYSWNYLDVDGYPLNEEALRRLRLAAQLTLELTQYTDELVEREMKGGDG